MKSSRFALASGSYARVELSVVITSEGRDLREVRLTANLHADLPVGIAILKPTEARLVAAALLAAADEAERVARIRGSST